MDKFCINCQHYLIAPMPNCASFEACALTRKETPQCLVSGKIIVSYKRCKTERSNIKGSLCGIEGLNFEAVHDTAE